MELFRIAEERQAAAWKVVKESRVVEIWEGLGAEVHLVGSLRSGLLIKKLDIDFHIYTDSLVVAESFGAMRQLAQHLGFREIQYRNLADTEEECLEWHVWYEDPRGECWKLDLIHIRKGSRYDGVVERMTDEIIRKLTPEIREAVLRIKYDLPDNVKATGVEIYQAVFSYGIRTCAAFLEWQQEHPVTNSLEWLP